MLRAVVLLFAVLGLLYFLFYPWLKNTVGRKKLFRWFLVVYLLATIASTVGSYLLD